MVQPATIAIVDDDPGIRGSLDSLLRSAALTSACFASAEDLLDGDDPARFRWIITDLHMPGMNGLDLQAEVARRGCDCSIIMMTAHPTAASEAQALHAGAAAFLAKPIDPDVLLDVLERGDAGRA